MILNDEELLGRYSSKDIKIINEYFDKLVKATRKSGKIHDPLKVKILKSWLKFDKDVVIEGLGVYLKLEIKPSEYGKGLNEKYTLGIIKNKQKYKNRVKGVFASGSRKIGTGESKAKDFKRVYKYKGDGQGYCDF